MVNILKFNGCLLISAGVCLQTLVFASLFRPFSYYESTIQVNTADSSTQRVKTAEESCNNVSRHTRTYLILPI